jgi:hypothetical protein
VAVHLAQRRRDARRTVARAAGREGALDVAAARQVPYVRELELAAAAALDWGSRRPHRRGSASDHQGSGERPRPASRTAALERRQQRLHARPALRGVGGEAAVHGPREPRGQRPRRRSGSGRDRGAEGLRARAGERSRAVQALEQRDAEAKLLRALVGRAPRELLRGHVRRGAWQRVGVVGLVVGARAAPGGARLAAGDLELGRCAGARSGEAEVGDDRPAVAGDQHVVGLEVAVQHADPVGLHEAAAGLHEHRQHRRPAARRGAQPGREGAAVDELHRQEHLPVDHADVVDRDHAGVAHAGHRPGLAQQAGRALGAVQLGADQLDRHLAIELWIVAGVDDPHAALPDPVEDHVAADAVAAAQRGDRLRSSGQRGAQHRRHAILGGARLTRRHRGHLT